MRGSAGLCRGVDSHANSSDGGKFEGQCEGNNYTACTTALGHRMHYSITTVSGRKRNKVKYETKKVINVYTEHIRVWVALFSCWILPNVLDV